nr:MAG TPA: hypothetical protein [Crassvirales sp.]
MGKLLVMPFRVCNTHLWILIFLNTNHLIPTN